MEDVEEWRPGSFTKNFSWGAPSEGLKQLYEVIRLGFDGELKDVTRKIFRQRLRRVNRPDYIPINFFLYNRIENGVDYIIVDELVFQALTSDHSERFDALGLFAFNLSVVGRFLGASSSQSRPALWANHYISDRVATHFGWDTSKITADDIERFVLNDRRYTGLTGRKLATNLNYLYRIGKLSNMASQRIDRWWSDALFLTLDRATAIQNLSSDLDIQKYSGLLHAYNFDRLGGPSSMEKTLATPHLISLYEACGGRARFSDEHVRERTELRLPDLESYLANDSRPEGAVYPTNPRILKSIPRACAMLANYVGFEIIGADELEMFDSKEFIRRRTQTALKRLKEKNIHPTMSAEDLMKITRDK